MSTAQTDVVCLFFRDYIPFHQSTSGPTWLNFLPSLYEYVPEGSMLWEAVSAVAFTNAAQKFHHLWFSIKAMNHYQTALKSVNATLPDHTAATSNSTLVSIILLALYEV